jgi:hypothetical protein
MRSKLVATAKVDIPERCLGRYAFESQFSSIPRPQLTDPYHPELAFRLAQLDVQNFAKPDRPVQPLNQRPSSADAGGPGCIHEWFCVRIQSPDANRKCCLYSRAPATIHLPIVGTSQREENLRQLHSKEPYRGYT